MRPMVSIIVPIYNAENYLRRCVDSILNQEYTDFELLLVNDGSTDASGDICEEYGDQDPRVIVIQKENTGVSDSRNRALDRARGKYLQFLDSDDWITPDATRLFVRAAEEYGCDMVISDFYRVVGERLSPKGDIEEEGVLTREEFAAHMMENPADFYYGVLWNKLYRRDIVEEHNLRMDTDINWCEDFMFNLEYIRYAKVFYALHAPIYYYVKRKGSLASQGINISKTVKMKLNVFEYYNNFYKHVLEEEDYEKNRLQVYRFFIDAAGDGTVPPSILPGSKKLGDERVFVNTEILQAEGLAGEDYRKRKLLEHYLEPVALKGDLKVIDVRLLLCLCEKHEWDSRRELADFAGISRTNLTSGLQRLTMKGFLKVEEVKEPKPSKKDKTTGKNKMKTAEMAETKRKERGGRIAATILPAADAIMKELKMAQRDYDAARFAGFTEEELIKYADLSEKIKENTKNILYFLN
ncbi:MAG TPA: glycosyl transferase family 2 [Lachnospiraceae bacterium]|nr:glycosyl transferase family 2 [Lachnospiraceae bacterium]